MPPTLADKRMHPKDVAKLNRKQRRDIAKYNKMKVIKGFQKPFVNPPKELEYE